MNNMKGTTNTKIKTLTCNCCGNYTKGRQWFNRDTGYGLCLRCGEEQEIKYSKEIVQDWAGIKGINWGVE